MILCSCCIVVLLLQNKSFFAMSFVIHLVYPGRQVAGTRAWNETSHLRMLVSAWNSGLTFQALGLDLSLFLINTIMYAAPLRGAISGFLDDDDEVEHKNKFICCTKKTTTKYLTWIHCRLAWCPRTWSSNIFQTICNSFKSLYQLREVGVHNTVTKHMNAMYIKLQYGTCHRYYVTAKQRRRPEWVGVWISCTNARRVSVTVRVSFVWFVSSKNFATSSVAICRLHLAYTHGQTQPAVCSWQHFAYTHGRPCV